MQLVPSLSFSVDTKSINNLKTIIFYAYEIINYVFIIGSPVPIPTENAIQRPSPALSRIAAGCPWDALPPFPGTGTKTAPRFGRTSHDGAAPRNAQCLNEFRRFRRIRTLTTLPRSR